MTRKAFPNAQNDVGQSIRVTIGTKKQDKSWTIDPSGPLTVPGGHTAESRKAMSQFIQKSKSDEISIILPVWMN